MDSRDNLGTNGDGAGSGNGDQTNHDLVEKIAERVWRIWKRELQIENERYRFKNKSKFGQS